MQPQTNLKALIGSRVRQILRAAHRRHVFRRGMRKFLKDPESCTEPGNTAINDLIYGWGNESWSAQNEFLAGCLEQALNTRGPILECGSGLSTILIGIIAKKRGIAHWALEDSEDWATRLKKYLSAYEIDSVVLCVKPLLDYGRFCWYDPPLASMPKRFALIICDGPPGKTKGGRVGLVSIMRTRLPAGSVILLDDAIRPHEREIAIEWNSALGTSLEYHGRTDPYIKLTVIGRRYKHLKIEQPSNSPTTRPRTTKPAISARGRA